MLPLHFANICVAMKTAHTLTLPSKMYLWAWVC